MLCTVLQHLEMVPRQKVQIMDRGTPRTHPSEEWVEGKLRDDLRDANQRIEQLEAELDNCQVARDFMHEREHKRIAELELRDMKIPQRV